MNATQIIIRNGQSHKNIAEEIARYESGVCTVTIEPGEPKKRSLSANAVQHVWYQQISKATGESRVYVERFCKLEFGVPILRNFCKRTEELEIRDFFEWTLKQMKFDERPYDNRLEIMGKLPVTRLMTSRQHIEYREQMQAHYAPEIILEVL